MLILGLGNFRLFSKFVYFLDEESLKIQDESFPICFDLTIPGKLFLLLL